MRNAAIEYCSIKWIAWNKGNNYIFKKHTIICFCMLIKCYWWNWKPSLWIQLDCGNNTIQKLPPNIITILKKIILSKCDFFLFTISYNAGKIQKDGRKESCKPILKVEYKTSRNRWVLSNKSQKLDFIRMCPDCTFSVSFITI